MMDTGTAHELSHRVLPLTFTKLTTLALSSCVGLLVSVSVAGETGVQSTAAVPSSSTASQFDSAADKALSDAIDVNSVRSGQIVVRTQNEQALRSAIDAVASEVDGVRIERPLNNAKTAFLVSSPDADSAMKVRELLIGQPFITNIQLDQSGLNAMRLEVLRRRQEAFAALRFANAAWPGPRPLPLNMSNRGIAPVDPLFPSQWHFINNHTVTPSFDPTNRDNNIPSSIYDTDGLSGAGVNVGISDQGLNTHLDTDHTQLVDNYRPSLSMPFDPTTNDSVPMTALAGIIAAKQDGVNIQGIAPEAGIGTYKWSFFPEATPLLEYNAFDWKTGNLAIKLYETFSQFTLPFESYNPNSFYDYVGDALQNSIGNGRQRKGVINIFGAGPGIGLLLPDPYNFPPSPAGSSFSPVDAWADGNEVSIGVTNGFTSGPFYPNGQVTYYPPANNRKAFIFNTVAEDGHFDVLSAQGPSIFASFYGGTLNQAISGDQTVSGQGVLTTFPGASNFSPFPASTGVTFSEQMTGPAIGAGVIALMLEVNPRLTIRDIQHILFQSIQDSSKSADQKWPNFDPTRSYYSPDLPIPRSFWQVNSGLYSSDTVTNQAIRHSDFYGFGMVDAALAIEKARNWRPVGQLVRLDTGPVGDIVHPGAESIDIEVPQADFDIIAEADGTTGTPGLAVLTPEFSAPFPTICVRQNIKIEAVELELTIEGGPSNDLYIELISPNGTKSILLMPTTLNFIGSADDDIGNDDDTDTSYAGVSVGTTTYSLYRHTFLTWKHWGELSGGEWNVAVYDYGPDDTNPEGEPPDDDPTGDPGADMVISLGEIGLPPSEFRDEHVITGYQLKIFGTEIGAPNFDGCNPLQTSCPADLDGNGIINMIDFQIFISWYLSGNSLADLDGDGDVDFLDLNFYRTLWTPGSCNPGSGVNGGLSGSDVSGDGPVIRPI